MRKRPLGKDKNLFPMVHGNGKENNEVRITFKDHYEWVVSNRLKDGRYDFYGTDNRH